MDIRAIQIRKNKRISTQNLVKGYNVLKNITQPTPATTRQKGKSLIT